MRWARRIALILLFGAALYLCVRVPALNGQPVRVDYLFGAVEEVPLWLALLAAFVVGAALTALLALVPLTRSGMRSRRYRKAARGLEAEVQELRSLPLAAKTRDRGGDEEVPETRERVALERGV